MPPTRTQAIHRSISRRRATSVMSGLDGVERPLRLLAKHVVVRVAIGLDPRALRIAADVPCDHEGAPARPAPIITWDEEAVVAPSQLGIVRAEPLHQGDVRL